MITEFQIKQLFETLNYPDWRDAAEFINNHTLDVEIVEMNAGLFFNGCKKAGIDIDGIDVKSYSLNNFLLRFHNAEHFEIKRSWESNN